MILGDFWFSEVTFVETNNVKKECINNTRQYNIQIFYKYIFFKYRTRQIKATETKKKTSVALICLVLYLKKIIL